MGDADLRTDSAGYLGGAATQLPAVAEIEALPTAPRVRGRESAFLKLLKNRGAVLGLAFIALVTFIGVVSHFFNHALVPYDPTAQAIIHANQGPSWAHPFGLDDLGRDILSRLMVACWISVRMCVQCVGIAALIAVPLGLLSGYLGGWFDNLAMRVMDALLSIPPLVLALAIAGVLGPSVGHTALALTIVLIPGFTRLVRASGLAVTQESFIDASRSQGTPTRRIMFKRVLPNIRSPLIVAMSLAFGGVILGEAGLSFLGLSEQPPNPSWGNMLRRAYDTVLYTHPWELHFAGGAIALFVLSLNTTGDALRDVLSPSQWIPARYSLWRRLVRLIRGGPKLVKSRRGITQVVRPPVVPQPAPMSSSLLSVQDLSVEFDTVAGPLRVVEDVSFDVGAGEVLGLVGESGSGKTVTSLSIMRLLTSPPGRITNGAVYFQGRDLLSLSFEEMRRVRGAEISMVFQDPMTSLNPSFTIGKQLTTALRLHEDVDRATARARALEMLEHVQLPAAEQRLDEFPHQLSGGMRQRVMLAIALICRPKLLIADEPTTALDVTIQAQILDLLRNLQSELDLSVIFVTHDLGVVADLCDRVVVMYAGEVVEQGTVSEIFSRPRHPYAEGLMTAMPQTGTPGEALYVIPGQVPHPFAWPEGCRFHPRCEYAVAACAAERVPLAALSETVTTNGAPAHQVRCMRHSELVLRGTQ